MSSRYALPAILLAVLGLTACSPAPTTPTPEPAASPTPPSDMQLPLPTATLAFPVEGQAAEDTTEAPETDTLGPYAVILLQPNESLDVHASAGSNSQVIGGLPVTTVNLMKTGASAKVGEDTWVEIQRPEGGTGWVNAHYLTESVAPDQFCADARVKNILNQLAKALNDANAERYPTLISPIHGLTLMYYRHGTRANYNREEAAWVFQSNYTVNWGVAPSGQATLGTFRQVPLPGLLDVLNSPYQLFCNDAGTAGAVSDPWPPEYTNINFYAIHKPGSPGVELDWRTWLVGIEYIRGRPRLFSLIHFQWEP